MATHRKSNTSYTSKYDLPKLAHMETTWDLRKHYYASEDDPRIEADVLFIERAYRAFAKKYRSLPFTTTSKNLHEALVAYEKLLSHAHGRRAIRYFDFRHTLNAKDAVAEKRSNLLENRLTKIGNEILFFDIALTKIPKIKQQEYLKDSLLAPFHYFLARTFLGAIHTLSEAEERILNLKSGPASSMWVQGTEKILSNREIIFKGKRVALPEAIELINTLAPREKQSLWNPILDELEQIAEVAENEFNAIITNKKISDELRHYKKPYSQTVLAYENNEKSVEALVEAITTKGFAISARFYNIKAAYHKTKELPYVRRYDSIGTPKTIPFREAVTICRDVFYQTHREYGAFFDSMLENGQIDVYPRRGKRGGAFMSSDIQVPTFVMLNQTDDVSSLSTLAHEMGHALHSYRSKTNRPLYEGYSITTAETASTLFENIVYNKLLSYAPPSEKKVLLHDKIVRDISTVQRQIAFFNYEKELHALIREQGAATKEELTHMMTKHLRSYLGSNVKVTERDGLSFVYISHFRYGFYVYTYAYGHLMSTRMAAQLESDPSFITQIDHFLRQGGSATVEHIFKSIGLDTTKVETFEKSLASLNESITTFEKLVS